MLHCVERMLVRRMMLMLVIMTVTMALGAGPMLMIATFRGKVSLGLVAVRNRRQMDRKHDQISRKREQRKPAGRPVSSEVQWFRRRVHSRKSTANMSRLFKIVNYKTESRPLRSRANRKRSSRPDLQHQLSKLRRIRHGRDQFRPFSQGDHLVHRRPDLMLVHKRGHRGKILG